MEQLMFPGAAKKNRADRFPENQRTCTMCGDFCAMERGAALFAGDVRGDKAGYPAK
jgi:phosphomethylpyrimidine synthase